MLAHTFFFQVGEEINRINGIIIHVILRLNTILPLLDDLMILNESVQKLPIWRISSGHRNGKLSQTSEIGKCGEAALTITVISSIFILVSSHFSPSTSVHNF